MQDLILASGSPRRRALLAALGLRFVVRAADVDEAALAGEAPDALVLRLSRSKACAIAGQLAGVVVLAADTVVVLDGRILGKPADRSGAVRMLRALRARVHQVYTAVSVACAHKGNIPPGDRACHDDSDADALPVVALDCAENSVALLSGLCRSSVWMRDYGDEEIQSYVASGDPLDKAGAYAIQHALFSPVARWEGCYTGIMGLPLGVTADLLRRAGVTIPAGVIAACEREAGQCCLRGLPGRC